MKRFINSMRIGGLVFLMLLLVGLPLLVLAAYDASDLIGQLDENGDVLFTTLGQNNSQNARGLQSPNGNVVVDATHHRLFVSDSNNNRILVFNLTTGNELIDRSADAVLGQTTFKSNTGGLAQDKMQGPTSLAYDASGDRLFVTDYNNTRVLVFDVASITNGELAVNVLGQDNFDDTEFGVTDSRFSSIAQITYDAGGDRLFVTDSGNNRILVFDTSSIGDGDPATDVIGQADFTSTQTGDNWTLSFDNSASDMAAITKDTTHGVLYSGSSNSGIIYRCDTSTACDASDDWTTSFDTTQTEILSMTFDSENGVLYAGTRNGGIIYRCDTATDCDAGGDWSVSFDTSSTRIWSLIYDATYGTLYAGTDGNSFIYRCDTLTDCNGAGDWTVSNDTAGGVLGLGLDTTNDVLYAGYGNEGGILRCLLATDCDDPTEWNVAYTDGEAGNEAWSFTFDPVHGMLYAGIAPDARILQCDTTTECDDTSEWDVVFTNAAQNRVRALAFESVSSVIYASSGNDGNIVHCDTTTDCNEQSDWELALNSPGSEIGSLYFDAQEEFMYAGSTVVSADIYRCDIDTGCGAELVGLSNPQGVAYDTAGNRIFAGDTGRHRVVVFDVATITPGEDPINVIGQPDFFTTDSAITQTGMNGPDNLSYDGGSSTLYVNDFNNSRVLSFDVSGITDGEPAQHVLGQEDFDTVDPRVTQDGLSGPHGVFYDPSTADLLWVTDAANNRILVFDASSIGDGDLAVDVLGQTDGAGGAYYTASGGDDAPNSDGLSDPSGVALDAVHHRLFIADRGNNRVLMFNLNSSNQITNRLADVVLGQSNIRSNTSGTTQEALSSPSALAYDADNDRLFVVDASNNRVVVFDVAVVATGESAINVIGQEDFVSSSGDITASTLDSPVDVAYDADNNRLFVAEYNNSRVTVFDVDPTVLVPNDSGTDGPDAINVIGQPDFVTGTPDMTRSLLSGLGGVVYDSEHERLFVADAENSRIMVFDVDPTVLVPNDSGTDGPDAINVIGSPDFTTEVGTTTQSTMNNGSRLAYDPEQEYLFSSGNNDNRIMVFDVDPTVLVPNDSGTDGPDAVNIFGQDDFVTPDSGTSQTALNAVQDVDYDSVAHRLYAIDASNNRAVLFDLVRITATTLPDPDTVSAYSQTITTTNSQDTLDTALTSGALPPGLSFVGDTISGTATTPGNYTFTIRATDTRALGAFFDDQEYTLTVATPSTPTPTPQGNNSGGGGGSGTALNPVYPNGTPTPSFSPSPTPTATVSPSPSALPSGSPSPAPTPEGSPGVSPSGSPMPSVSGLPQQSTTPPSSSSPDVPGEGPLAPVVDTVRSFFSGIGAASKDIVEIVTYVAVAVGTGAAAAGIAVALAQREVIGIVHGMFQAVGLKRKARAWGVVYDAVTKRPVPFARVSLLDDSGRVLETRYADRDGRYGFLASPASLHEGMRILIRPEKEGYAFPSARVTSDTDYIVYDHLYRGEALSITKETPLNFNIPLEPVAKAIPSWVARVRLFLASAGDRLLNVGFYLGAITAPINFILNPSTTSLVLLSAFVVINAIRILIIRRPFGTIRNARTGKPVPFALVTLDGADGKRVAFSVSDEAGRFILSGPKGRSYEATAHTPAQESPQRTARTRIGKLFGQGWVTSTIRI